jgi:autotransporter strand-loop-strand O-heptosyltransferase
MKVASDILGLDYVELKPKLKKLAKKKKKLVSIAIHSTAQCKYWNNENGWIQVTDYLNNLGYDVVCIDRHENFGLPPNHMNNIPHNAINKTGDIDLEDRINDLQNCEFFIGLGSGLSWLAWACEKPVIMISGFSDPKSEFYTPYRVHNKNVCNSCWNDKTLPFERENWLWCPRNKNFECSKQITFEMVKEKIDNCIVDINR